MPTGWKWRRRAKVVSARNLTKRTTYPIIVSRQHPSAPFVFDAFAIQCPVSTTRWVDNSLEHRAFDVLVSTTAFAPITLHPAR